MQTRSRKYHSIDQEHSKDAIKEEHQDKKVKLASIIIVHDNQGTITSKEMQFIPEEVSIGGIKKETIFAFKNSSHL